MPPHQRHFQQQPDQGGMQQQPQTPQRPMAGQPNVFSRVNSDITALNSSILLLSQKMRFLIRNEKILGRNLIVVNKKLKEMQESRIQGSGPIDSAAFGNEFSQISSRLDEITERLVRMESEVENIRQNYAKSEQVSEIKYVVNSINPLEFATLKDVQEIVSGKGAKAKK